MVVVPTHSYVILEVRTGLTESRLLAHPESNTQQRGPHHRLALPDSLHLRGIGVSSIVILGLGRGASRSANRGSGPQVYRGAAAVHRRVPRGASLTRGEWPSSANIRAT